MFKLTSSTEAVQVLEFLIGIVNKILLTAASISHNTEVISVFSSCAARVFQSMVNQTYTSGSLPSTNP